MNLWKTPTDYAGEDWSEYFVFLGRNRDSGPIEECNFQVGLSLIGGESNTVIVVSESHWAVGWAEWIAIHQSDDKSIETANEALKSLDEYPVLDEISLPL